MPPAPSAHSWLHVHSGDSPLIVSIPHAGIDLPSGFAHGLRSEWLARRDADWHLPQLYDFAPDVDATVIRTTVSRTVVDVNRDPSGASLYPGMTTTALCPLETFDGDPLYEPGREPDAAAVAARRQTFHAPYHATLAAQIARLHTRHERVVVYDAHSIRSRIPRLFDGVLPHLNLGTNDAHSCDPGLTAAVLGAIRDSGFTHVVNGRFKGGYITRHCGQPDAGVHAIQMEIACRAYLDEPEAAPCAGNWPPSYDPARAASLRAVLRGVLDACARFAQRAR